MSAHFQANIQATTDEVFLFTNQAPYIPEELPWILEWPRSFPNFPCLQAFEFFAQVTQHLEDDAFVQWMNNGCSYFCLKPRHPSV